MNLVVDCHAHLIVPGTGADVVWDEQGQVVRLQGREIRTATREIQDVGRILEEQDGAGVGVGATAGRLARSITGGGASGGVLVRTSGSDVGPVTSRSASILATRLAGPKRSAGAFTSN